MTTKKSVVIDDVTWKAAKREAKKNGMLLSPFIVRAIRMALEVETKKAKAAGK